MLGRLRGYKMLSKKDIHSIMENLSNERPLFHSEADFQFALAWGLMKIKEKLNINRLRLEKPFNLKKRIMVDIFIEHNNKKSVIIELKYKVKKVDKLVNGEMFSL